LLPAFKGWSQDHMGVITLTSAPVVAGRCSRTDEAHAGDELRPCPGKPDDRRWRVLLLQVSGTSGLLSRQGLPLQLTDGRGDEQPAIARCHEIWSRLMWSFMSDSRVEVAIC
jgi:hypothetical protein